MIGFGPFQVDCFRPQSALRWIYDDLSLAFAAPSTPESWNPFLPGPGRRDASVATWALNYEILDIIDTTHDEL
ncbi:hypothetical protein FRC07_000568, partial [Ceratobasidium sp. 392]